MLTVIDGFSLALQNPAVEETAYQTPRAAVLRQGHAVGLAVDGVKLEAQFRVNTDAYLLLVSDDCPYEETLRVYLLNNNYNAIDYARLAYAYTAGVLRDIQIVGDNVLEFAFTGSSRYRLTVHDRPRHFWNASGGAGEAFRFLSKRHLEITREALDARQEIR